MPGIFNFSFLSGLNRILIYTSILSAFSISAGAREVSLQWDSNSEPDLSHYVVYWGPGSGAYTNDSGDIGLVTTYTCTLPDDGLTYYFAVTAVDEAGLESDYSNEVNTGDNVSGNPPTADAGPDQNVNEGTIVYLDGTNSNDPDEGTLTYQWVQTGGSDLTLNDSASAQPSFNAPDIESEGESLTFQLTVTDEEDLQSTDTCVINIVSMNNPPSADAGPDQNVNEGSLVYLDGSNSIDPDGDSLTYLWTQTAGISLTLDNPASVQPIFDAPDIDSEGESLSFQLTVTDENGLQSTDSCVVNIISVNNPPAADAGPDQNINEGTRVYLNGANSSDPDGDSLTYLWTQTAGTSVTLDNPASVQPLFDAPDIDTEGDSLIFQLTVTDEHGLQSTDSCLVNIVSANSPPVASAGPDQTVDEGAVVTLNGTGSGDPDGDILSFKWIQTGGTSVTLSSSSTATPEFAAFYVDPEGESLTFQLTVTDEDGLQSTDTCIVNITWVNDPPVANAGPDQNVNEGSSVTLNGSGSSDPDGDVIYHSWTQVSGSSVTFNGAKTANPTVDIPYINTGGESLIFQLTVTDEGGLQSTDSCIVNIVSVNNPPSANAGSDQTVDEGSSVILNGSNSNDPDGDSLTYEWIQTNGPPVALDDVSSVQTSFDAPDVDETGDAVVFQLTVTDEGGLYSTDTCVVNISWVNEAPTADAGSDQTVDEGTIVTLNGSGSSDIDDDTLSYEWTQISGPEVSINNSSSILASFQTPDVNINGDYLTFEITVTDPYGLQSKDRCIINVICVNEAPIADAGLDQTVDMDTVVTLSGINSTDLDDGIVSYLWTQTSGYTVNLSDPGAVNPTFTANTEGALTFMLTVTDAGGLQTNDSCIINVTNGNQPPISDAGTDQTVNEGDIVQLNGIGSTDPEGSSISYFWTQTAGTTVTLSDPAAANPEFIAPLEGALTFTLTVTNADGLKSTDLCIINVVHVNLPPEADAGSNQYVQEGDTVILDASGSTDHDDGIAFYLWTQTGGTAVALSDPADNVATFVAPPVNKTDTLLKFDLKVTDNSGLMSSTSVNINVSDNGITVFPENVTSIISWAGTPVGINVDSGGSCTNLETVDPLPLLDKSNAPLDLPYGLLNFRIKVNNPGDTAVVSIYFPENVSEEYSWYKYESTAGWEDFGEHAVYNLERNRLTLTLVDGGPGDEDKVANGEIIDPSGLGLSYYISSSVKANDVVGSFAGEVGGGDAGGCFIATAYSPSFVSLTDADWKSMNVISASALLITFIVFLSGIILIVVKMINLNSKKITLNK